MKDASGLQYFLTDHLGSVVATLAPHCVRCSAGVTNDVGTLTSEQRYLPFGAERTDIGVIAQTDYGYTGLCPGLDCGNGGLTLFVNGQRIDSVGDSVYTSGVVSIFYDLVVTWLGQ